MIKILNPVSAPRDRAGQRLSTVPGFKGVRVGILSNHWKSMDRMTKMFGVRATTVYAASLVQLYDIPINGPMTDLTEQRVLNECDVAIIGLAN